MKPATATVRIKRPPAQVREVIGDLARHQEYLDHFLVDWEITSETSRGVGATARTRAKGGGSDDIIEASITSATDDEIVLESRSGRKAGRRMRLVYALGEPDPPDPPGTATQVNFTLELLHGSVVDQATWALPRAHLERMYGQALLRLKGLVEGEPRSL